MQNTLLATVIDVLGSDFVDGLDLKPQLVGDFIDDFISVGDSDPAVLPSELIELADVPRTAVIFGELFEDSDLLDPAVFDFRKIIIDGGYFSDFSDIVVLGLR